MLNDENGPDLAEESSGSHPSFFKRANISCNRLQQPKTNEAYLALMIWGWEAFLDFPDFPDPDFSKINFYTEIGLSNPRPPQSAISR